MKLADWARKQGISYVTALRWYKNGSLPVPATQMPSGTILVEDVPPQETKVIPAMKLEEVSKLKEDIAKKTAQVQNNSLDKLVQIVTREVASELNSIIEQKMRAVLGAEEEKSEINIEDDANWLNQTQQATPKKMPQDPKLFNLINEEAEKTIKPCNHNFTRSTSWDLSKAVANIHRFSRVGAGEEKGLQGSIKNYDIDGAIDRLVVYYLRYGFESTYHPESNAGDSIFILKELARFRGETGSTINITELAKLIKELVTKDNIRERREVIEKLRNLLLDYVYPLPRKEVKTKTELSDDDISASEKDKS